MINYNLKVVSVLPLSNNKPKQAIVLCHGYGGDGKDISMLAINWQRFLPDAIFLCPNAPDICSINPNGYQWFDLESDNEEKILENSLIAEDKLSIFLDQALDNLSLNSNNLALVGFSQGCMMSIQVALKKKEKINCVIGYSGKIINVDHLNKNLISRPNIFLMHGDIDEVVPVNFFLEAKDFFIKNKYKIETKIFENCEHRIPTEGSSLGLQFIKKNLY